MKYFNQNVLSGLTYKFGLFLLAAIFSGFVAGNAPAQTLLVNYNFASAVAGTPCTASPLTMATGVTSTFTTGGTGGGTCTTPAGTSATSPPAFTANAANQSVSLTSFTAGSSNFYQFQLSGVSSFSNYMLFFQAQRSGSGPVNTDVQYSTNGTTFTTFQTVNPGNGAFAAFTIDLSSVSAIEGQPTVFFRILGSSGTGAAGTFRLDNFQAQAQTALAGTASIGGQVRNADGRGIGKVQITLTGSSTGNTRTVITSSFGYYNFEEVAVGETYVVSASSKTHTFENPTRIISLSENVGDADFISIAP